MSLLDKASLVVTPNAYKESKLYSVIPSDGSGDMTVVRATTATRINSAGLVEVVPRNLFTNSNDFANASWNKQNTSITANSIVSPDGTQNASKFIANSTNAFHAIYSGAGAYYGDNTFSVYAKKGEYNFLILQDQFSSAFYNTFNIDSGTILGGTNGTITSVGNGWYRCSVKFTAPAGNVFPTITIAPTSGGASYLGNSTSGAYLYGAQIEQGITASEFLPTTTRLNIPRIDYTNGSCPSLLVEPQRSNLLTYSEQFNDASWAKANMVIVANNTTSPDGTNSADKATASSYPSTSLTKTNLLTAASYTSSIYVKADTVSTFRIDLVTAGFAAGGNCIFNLTTLATTITNYGATTGTTAKIENVGNGWYRCSLTVTATALTYFNQFYPAANGSVFIWGAQLEVGAYATSYIPTVASTVTRNADVISKTGISSLIGQTEGTIFLDFNVNNLSSQTADPVIFSTSGTNYIRLFTTRVISYFESNTVSISSASNVIINGRNKIAANYKNNEFSLYVNGVLVGSNNSGSVVAKSNFALNYIPTSVFDPSLFYNSVQLYKTRLTNAECIALTTL